MWSVLMCCSSESDFRRTQNSVSPLSKIKRFARSEDGLRAVAEHAPQAEAFAATWIERLRPLAVHLHRLRHRIATVAVCLLAASLFVHVMFGANGMPASSAPRGFAAAARGIAGRFGSSAERLRKRQRHHQRPSQRVGNRARRGQPPCRPF